MLIDVFELGIVLCLLVIVRLVVVYLLLMM